MDVNGIGFNFYMGFGGEEPPKKAKKQKREKLDFVAGFPNYVRPPQSKPIDVKGPSKAKETPAPTPPSSLGSNKTESLPPSPGKPQLAPPPVKAEPKL